MTVNGFHNYYVSGECSDHGWLTKNQDLFELEMREEMRKKGYIPVLDAPVVYTWDYDSKSGLCKFQAVAKGLKSGRKKSRESMGILSKEGIIVGKEGSSVQLVPA